jgi:hypothetical protein
MRADDVAGDVWPALPTAPALGPAARHTRTGSPTRSCPVGGGRPSIRGLHSFTFQLNVSAFCGVGGAYRGYIGGVKGV